jgi:hypothetical protein
MRPFRASQMRMWPISTRVNKPENDDPSIVEPTELTPDAGVATFVFATKRFRAAAVPGARSGF